MLLIMLNEQHSMTVYYGINGYHVGSASIVPMWQDPETSSGGRPVANKILSFNVNIIVLNSFNYLNHSISGDNNSVKCFFTEYYSIP